MRHIRRRAFSSQFQAAQLAGSCRIEGIKVTAGEELVMCQIIDGQIDGKHLRQVLVAQIKAKGSAKGIDLASYAV